MSRKSSLRPADRQFLGLVASAAFANPFSDERAEIDHRIAEAPGPLSSDERIRRLTPRLAERLRKLEAEGRADVSAYDGEDREIVETAFLFETYHAHIGELDRLIGEQIEAGDEPCAVPFARRVLQDLARRGFTAEESRRHLAMLYQLRRAYFFIGTGLPGGSACMKELRRRLWQNVVTQDIRLYARHLMDRMEDFSTLLLGETGTGKGTAAAAIGRSGYIPFDEKHGRFTESFTRAFVAMNLSQHPESLIESELFGHRKGAFTGAVEGHDGIFSRCSPHGAIFLDEIGEVSVPVQIKLLEVLQERVYSPVGSHEKRRFRGRVVAATNRPIGELRKQGAFRDDFFYRLCSDLITVPPLRRRIDEDPGELPALLEHVIRRLVGVESPDLVGMVADVLARSLPPRYEWPGNVRELEQAARRILLTKSYEGHERGATAAGPARLLRGIEDGSLGAEELLRSYSKHLFEKLGTYADVARRTGLDRRTVKKHIEKDR
jgi:DNA-binding NtrC family response regulator